MMFVKEKIKMFKYFFLLQTKLLTRFDVYLSVLILL